MKTIDELIDFTARVESGGSYSAWNPNDHGAGVSFGLIQFNQKKGSLETLCQRMFVADPELFMEIFGAIVGGWLTLPGWIRNAGGMNKLKAEFQAAGAHPPFQQAQRDLARERYFEPAVKLARSMGIATERGLAMAFDICVQYGLGGLVSKLTEALTVSMRKHQDTTELHVLDELAVISDAHIYDANRRHHLLATVKLSDEPWTGLPVETRTQDRPMINRGSRGEAVLELTRALFRLGYMTVVTTSFGPVTEKALRRFQADWGLVADATVGPVTWKKLDEAMATVREGVAR